MRTQAVKVNADNQHQKTVIEEYVLENSCLNIRPVELSTHYPMQKAHQLKTVSIIETLSELARGETDKEDNGNVFLPVNNLSLLPDIQRARGKLHCLCQSQGTANRLKNCKTNERFRKQIESLQNNNNVHCKGRNRNCAVSTHVHDTHSAWSPRSRENATRFDCSDARQEKFTISHSGVGKTDPVCLSDHHNQIKVRSSNFHSRLPYLALRYTSSNHVTSPVLYEEKGETGKHRWNSTGSRHCFSDSEIDGFEFDSMVVNKSKARSKCTSENCLDAHLSPDCAEYLKGRHSGRSGYESEKTSGNKSKKRHIHKKNKMPEWISSIFRIAKEGKVEKIETSLKDMDGALVRNLSDCSGNNLWHIACSHNHLSCIQWLCAQFGQVALVDENKHGLTPVVSAVKRGSLAVLQWLLQKKYDQGLSCPSDGKRTLLHFAAKYGQLEILQWLESYFINKSYDLNSKDADGNTALHLAAKYGYIQCIKNLTLEGCDLTARNNFGHKPYDVAVSNRQLACSEYLIALETCFSLSTGSYLLESDLQRFQMENTSTRKNFKELQQLMRTSIYHQKELLETFRTVCQESQLLEEEANEQSAESEKGEEQSAIRQGFQNRVKEEFERWYSNALLKDEATFHLLEEKWKRQFRRGSKHMPENKSPLHIVRSQFAQVYAKATSSSPAAEMSLTTSDTSLSEESSGDELDLPLMHKSSTFPAFLEDIPLNEMLNNPTSFPYRNATSKPTAQGHGYSPIKRGPLTSRLPPNLNRRTSLPAQCQLGTSLKTLFEKNPELRQEGQTCTVLEVLEPSSSDNDELFHRDSSLLNVSRSAQDLEKSLCTTPKSQRVSSFVKLLENCQHAVGTRHTKDNGNSYFLPHKNNSPLGGTKESLFLEPPLNVTVIKTREGLVRSKGGHQNVTNRTQNEKNSQSKPSEQKPAKNSDEKSTPDRSEDRSLSGTDVSISDSTDSAENILESSPKKRGFLLKFSLKNRWSSKHKRSTKKLEGKLSTEPRVVEEKLSSSSLVPPVEFNGSASAPISEEEDQLPSVKETTKSKGHDRIIPQRREPPPPVDCSKEIDACLGFSEKSIDVMSTISVTDSVPMSTRDENIETRQFCSLPDELSRLYGSTMKLDSRPPSSASRINLTPRSEDSFKVVGLPLRKTLSASTELLVTPDCSTAGRQSPAQSEVSKTESALSPPSDVSKTESMRHLNHLGKIDERANVKIPVEIMDLNSNDVSANSEKLCFEEFPVADQANECRKSDKKAETSSKPWYEVSDDEDLLGPGHFQATVPSNSEDETSEMLL